MQNQYSKEAQVVIETALEVLDKWGIPTAVARSHYANALEEWRKQPTDEDRGWPWVEPESIATHVNMGDRRPVLSCKVGVGRAYELSPGQRDFIRDHYNMTPSRLVKVIEVALYPQSKCIRRVTLVSEEHVDPRRRKMVVKLSIDNWGRFCAESLANDEARRVETEPVEDDDQPTKAKVKVSKSQVNLKELFNEYGID